MEESVSRLGDSSMRGRFCRAVIKIALHACGLDIFQTYEEDDAQQDRERHLRK